MWVIKAKANIELLRDIIFTKEISVGHYLYVRFDFRFLRILSRTDSSYIMVLAKYGENTNVKIIDIFMYILKM